MGTLGWGPRIPSPCIRSMQGGGRMTPQGVEEASRGEGHEVGGLFIKHLGLIHEVINPPRCTPMFTRLMLRLRVRCHCK